jgi:hypothetical protein
MSQTLNYGRHRLVIFPNSTEISERYKVSNIPHSILSVINNVLFQIIYLGTVVIQECVRFEVSKRIQDFQY